MEDPVRSFFIKFFLLLSLLCTLISCGGSKVTKAEFVVGKGFAISNSGYEGGLTIYGRHLTTNESFAYSSLPNSGQNQIVLDLAKGSWSFGVVGWSGGGSGNNLQGSAYCGGVDQVDLSSASQTINLSATIANCLSSKFASPSMVATSPTQSLKAIQLILCPKISAGTISSSPSFCSDQTISSSPLDESLGDDIWGIKLRLPHQPLPGTTPGTIVESACIPASSLGYFDLAAYQIPTKNLPLNIVTFKNKDCTQASNAFSFERGIEADYTSSFDKIFSFPVSAENPKIFLASTRSKRDSSPLEAIIPKITCGGAGCGFIKPMPGGSDLVISGGQAGSKSQIILSTNISCASFSNFAGTGGLIAGDCENRRGGGASLQVSTTTAVDCESTNCSLSYDYEGTPATPKSVKALLPSDSQTLWQQERIISYLGIENSMYSNPLIFSLGHLDNIKRSNGLLHDIAEMFSAHGPAGAYKDIATCPALTGTRFIDAFDEGIYKRYQIEIVSIAENAPRQICADTLSANGSCNSILDKKMILREPLGGVFKATEVIKFDCDKKIGYSEGTWNDSEQDGSRAEKMITYWNTETEAQTRVQQYSYEQKTNLANQLVNSRTHFIDLSRGDYISFTDSILISDSSYEYHFDPGMSTKTERVSRSEYAITAGTEVYTSFKEYFNSTATSAGGLFVMPEVEQFLKAKSIHQHHVSAGDFNQTATSPNGNYRLIVNFTSGMPFSYKIYNGSTYKAGTGNLSTNFSQADISINDSGKAVIAYSGTSWVKFLTIDGSLSNPTVSSEIDPMLTVSPSPIYKVQVFVGNDDLITIAAKNYSNNINAKIVDLAGAIPAGNLSSGFDYTSSFTVTDFIIRHTDGMNANLCYVSSGYLKCLKLVFPTMPFDSANFTIPTPSDQMDPTILVSGLSGSSLQLYLDPTCLQSISSAGAVSGTIVTTGLNIGLNNIYYKIDGGSCTPTGLSYYKSSTGRYEDTIISQITSPEGILSKQAVYQNGDFIFNFVDDSQVPKKIAFSGSAITPTTSGGSNLNVRKNNQTQIKSSEIGLSSPNNTPGDFDKGDVPVKYPLYDGSLSGLKPQTFVNLFTPSQTFSGQ